jgi:hypothetical protein
VASSDEAPYNEEEDRKRSVSAGQSLGLVGLVPVDVDRKDGPRKERLHSLSSSKHFTNLNLGGEKTKVWTRFCKHFLNLILLENNL